MKGHEHMNALVKQKNQTEIAKGGDDPFASAGSDMSSGGGLYLKFNGNTGEFTYGAEGAEIPKGALLIANPAEGRRGWICWKDEEVVDEIMKRIVDGAPPEEYELPDHGPYTKNDDGSEDGWSKQSAIPFLFREEDGNIVELTYKTSSISALRALGELFKQYAKAYKSHPGELPVVEFDVSSWIPKNKKWGKKFSPVFKIVDWKSEEELAAEVEGSEGDYDDDDAGEEVVEQIEAPKESPKEEVKKEPAPAAASQDKPAVEPKARRRSF